MSPRPPWTRRARTTSASTVEVQAGRVEEEDLPGMRLHRIERQARDRRSLSRHRDGCLELDGVRVLEQLQDACDVGVGQARGARPGGAIRDAGG